MNHKLVRPRLHNASSRLAPGAGGSLLHTPRPAGWGDTRPQGVTRRLREEGAPGSLMARRVPKGPQQALKSAFLGDSLRAPSRLRGQFQGQMGS
ncbi:hypothetical protein E2C01_066001 [Portunus trituberculatus]|uniref:Uncharacterized protein n=1 Tax=Portunus trituberculatus TaxID=210409 RepID=A0A5B7HPY0_PORTR|nr:hypothetical protein [Portunus trituberculatus]